MQIQELAAIAQAVGRMINKAHPDVGFIIVVNVLHESNPTTLHTSAHSNMVPALAGEVLKKVSHVYATNNNQGGSN